MSFSKKLGKIAEKMLDVTNSAVKKLEDYGAKSAAENQNENAKKLEDAMKKLSQKIEENKEAYVKKVEENAIEIESSLKGFCKDIKKRTNIAQEKANKDTSEKE
jgi:DNA-binding ferritin-like protein